MKWNSYVAKDVVSKIASWSCPMLIIREPVITTWQHFAVSPVVSWTCQWLNLRNKHKVSAVVIQWDECCHLWSEWEHDISYLKLSGVLWKNPLLRLVKGIGFLKLQVLILSLAFIFEGNKIPMNITNHFGVMFSLHELISMHDWFWALK